MHGRHESDFSFHLRTKEDAETKRQAAKVEKENKWKEVIRRSGGKCIKHVSLRLTLSLTSSFPDSGENLCSLSDLKVSLLS